MVIFNSYVKLPEGIHHCHHFPQFHHSVCDAEEKRNVKWSEPWPRQAAELADNPAVGLPSRFFNFYINKYDNNDNIYLYIRVYVIYIYLYILCFAGSHHLIPNERPICRATSRFTKVADLVGRLSEPGVSSSSADLATKMSSCVKITGPRKMMNHFLSFFWWLVLIKHQY